MKTIIFGNSTYAFRLFSGLVLLLVFVGVSCARKDDSCTLRIGYFPNMTHSQAIIGLARGDFAREIGTNVRIEPKLFNAGPAAIEALFAGSLDICYIGPNPAINGYVKSHGKALRIIAGATSGGAALIVRKESGILTDKDFVGKRIATPQLGNTQDVALRAWLKSRGLAIPESINIANVNYENVTNVAEDTSTGDNEVAKVRGVRSSEVLESVSIAGSHFTFDVVNAFDNDMSTSWQPKQPVGGWIEMIMTKKQNYKISIVNGFAWNHQQLGSLYYNNNRVASITVEYGETYSLSKKIDLIADNQTYQDIGTYNTDRLRITVLSVYWGARWKDTAISEIRVEPIN